MTQNKQKTIKVNVDTAQKLKFMAKANSQSRPEFLKELVDELFPLCGEFKEIKILYEGRLDTHTLNVMVCPKATYTMPIAPLSIAVPKTYEIPVKELGVTKKETYPKEEVEKKNEWGKNSESYGRL